MLKKPRTDPCPIITNTPRAGESAEQTAARTAARGEPSPVVRTTAKLFYTTHLPGGPLFVNIQTQDGVFLRIEVTRDQLSNLVIDGVKFLVEERA